MAKFSVCCLLLTLGLLELTHMTEATRCWSCTDCEDLSYEYWRGIKSNANCKGECVKAWLPNGKVYRGCAHEYGDCSVADKSIKAVEVDCCRSDHEGCNQAVQYGTNSVLLVAIVSISFLAN